MKYGQDYKKWGEEKMIENSDDLVVLDEGHSKDVVANCCTTSSAKLK